MVKAVLDCIPDYRVDLDGVYEHLGQPEHDRAGQAAARLHPGSKGA
jgi:hypothetical protein